jgi:hypothetical protein
MVREMEETQNVVTGKRLLVAAPDLFEIEDETVDGAGACYGRAGFNARLASLGVYANLLRIGIDQPA